MRLAGEPFARERFVRDFDIDDIGQPDIGALACIVRTAEHGVTEEPVCRHAEIREARANRSFEIGFGMVEWEFDFA
ncbi:hypothetical protein GCM10027419_06670 [Pandoraea terrae]